MDEVETLNKVIGPNLKFEEENGKWLKEKGFPLLPKSLKRPPHSLTLLPFPE